MTNFTGELAALGEKVSLRAVLGAAGAIGGIALLLDFGF
jgi:hypothetical protein